MTYMSGYAGATLTEAQLVASPTYNGIDPEFARRCKNLFDFCVAQGQAIGIGGGLRSTGSQTALFLQRHTEVASGGCCSYNGRRYKLRAGMAHAAPPGQSYHEPVTPTGKALAIDAVGATIFAGPHCPEFGLVHFGPINGELWHYQPIEIPHGRNQYNAATMNPLAVWGAASTPPPVPPAAKPPIVVPVPSMQQGSMGPEVFKLQEIMKFWGWYPATTKSDGSYGPVTVWCVAVMQQAFRIVADGGYGKQTAEAYRAFATNMQNLGG